MEHLLRQGQPGLRQHLLIYGKEYKLWRDGVFLGTAIYADDENLGDVFLKKVAGSMGGLNDDGSEEYLVFVADEWELI